MKLNKYTNRIIALVLTFAVSVSMGAFTLVEAFADEEAQQETANEVQSEQQEISTAEEATDGAIEESGDNAEVAAEEANATGAETETEEILQTGQQAMPASLGNEGQPITRKFVDSVGAMELGWNLRDMIAEGYGGYAVVQGTCTDGTYAYYLMVCSDNQKGRVLKVELATGAIVGRSEALPTKHGNGMTYEPVHNRLIVIDNNTDGSYLYMIDAGALQYLGKTQLDCSNYTGSKNVNIKNFTHGLKNIAYVEEYDCFVAMERSWNNIVVFSNPANADWNQDSGKYKAIGLALMKDGDKKIEGTDPHYIQDMDADGRYVYAVHASYPGNAIVVVDWHGDDYIRNICGDKTKFAEDDWACGGTEDTGNYGGWKEPDKAITVSNSYETESLFHTTDQNGNRTFYLASYRSHTETSSSKQKVAYKVKWKKVWKKYKVKKKYKQKQWFNTKKQKWTKKKPAKKYRGGKRTVIKYKTVKKKKKVWKYKTKYKTKTVKTSTFCRDDYAYRLGSLEI